MKIRAAVLREMGLSRPYAESRPVVIDEVELDPPGPGEVLVKVAAAGLCHSDLSVINGARPRAMPMVLGHEAAGVIEELGEGADDLAVGDLAVGDHVVMVFVPSCGQCLPCMAGRPALCEPGAVANASGTLLSGARRLHMDGKEINHQVGVSCFAERAVLDRHSLVKIDKDLPLEEAALFGCAVLTGAGAVLNTAATPAGATVAIVGLGGVGLSALLAAAAIGASRIVAVDLLDSKLALARQLGASHTANAGDADCVEQIREATGGGVDFAFEMAGAVEAMDIAYRITRRGGTTVTAGLSPPEHDFRVQHVNIVAEERTIKGSYIGSSVPARDVPRFIDMFRQGRLPVDRLLSERVGLDDLNLAFDRLADGNTVRQILVP
jgi:alcohol dehydrogenase